MAECDSCAELREKIEYLRSVLLLFTGADGEMDLYSLKVVYEHTKKNGKKLKAIKALLETMEIEEYGDSREINEEMPSVQEGEREVSLSQECCPV